MLEPMQALEPVDVLEPGAHRSAPGGRVRPRRTVGRRRGVRPVARVVSSIDRIAASHRRSSGVSVGTARPVGAVLRGPDEALSPSSTPVRTHSPIADNNTDG
ncbi:hypothetical protein CS378_03675 [Rhodococcus ruber]|nr:hypothetical protein CS378_03675 [Rhodococcus ruber]